MSAGSTSITVIVGAVVNSGTTSHSYHAELSTGLLIKLYKSAV